MTTLTHTIASGETLSHLGLWYYGDSGAGRYNQIAADNGIANPDLVHVGQLITLIDPVTDRYGNPVQTAPPPPAVIAPVAPPAPVDYADYYDVDGNLRDGNTHQIIAHAAPPAIPPSDPVTVVIPVQPAAPVVPAAPPSSSYRVVYGDTLSAIAVRFGTTVNAIMAANRSITNPNVVTAGSVLQIPSDTYTAPGSVGGVAVSQGTSTTGITYVAVTFDTQAEAAAAAAAVAAGGFVGMDPSGTYVLSGAMVGVQGITDDIADALLVVESSIGVHTGLTPGIIGIGENLRHAGNVLQDRVDQVTGYDLGSTGGTSNNAGSAAPVTYETVLVRPGDTLSVIASSHGITLIQLLVANPQFQANPNVIHPGDTVVIPNQQGTNVATTTPGQTTTNSGVVGTLGVTNQPAPSGTQVAQWLPQLSWGSKLYQVTLLQQALNVLIGVGLVEDGDFGPATDGAVRDYQGLNGLVVDGTVGPITWSHILSGLAAGGHTSILNQLTSNAGPTTTVSNSEVSVGGNVGAVSATVGQFMAAIRQIESSGNYSAVGPDTRWGRAGGAYQFIQDTWDRAITTYAPSQSRWIGTHPSEVPSDVQNAVAQAWFNGLYQRYGSWELVAVAHFAGEGTANRAEQGANVWTISDVLGTSVAGYVQKTLAAMGASTVTLANPGTTTGTTPTNPSPLPVGSDGLPILSVNTAGIREEVRVLQRALLALGYELPTYGADGDFGGETERALERFQSDNGLSPTGATNVATWQYLQARLGANHSITADILALANNGAATTTPTNPGTTIIDGPGGAPPVYLTDMPTLSVGTPGPDEGVRILQRALTALGQPLTDDGYFGGLTSDALYAVTGTRTTTPSAWQQIASALLGLGRSDLVTAIRGLEGSAGPGGVTPGSTGVSGITVQMSAEELIAWVKDQNLSAYTRELAEVTEAQQFVFGAFRDPALQAAYNLVIEGRVTLPQGAFVSTHRTLDQHLYVVQAGDSLSGIAALFGSTAATIASDTGIGVSSTVHPGTLLAINNPDVIPNGPSVDLPNESITSQTLRGLNRATRIMVLEEFFADFLDPTAAANQINDYIAGGNLTFEQAIERAQHAVGPYNYAVEAQWGQVLDGFYVFNLAVEATGSYRTAAEVVHLVAYDGMRYADALDAAQIPEVPVFEPEGNTTYEQIEYTASLIAQFETGNVPGGQVTGAYLAQMRATLTDLLSQVTDNSRQINIARVLLANGWEADEAVAIAVIWNQNDATLDGSAIVAMLAQNGVLSAFIQAERNGLSLRQAAHAAYDAAIAPDIFVPTEVGGELGATLQVIYHLLQPGVFDRLKDAAGDGDDDGIEVSDIYAAQNYYGDAGDAARLLIQSYEGDQVAWNILDQGRHHDHFINSNTFSFNTGGDDDLHRQDIQEAETNIRLWLALAPVREGRGWERLSMDDAAGRLTAAEIVTVLSGVEGDRHHLAEVLLALADRIQEIAFDEWQDDFSGFPYPGELSRFVQIATTDPELGGDVYQWANQGRGVGPGVAGVVGGEITAPNEIAAAAIATIVSGGTPNSGPFIGYGFMDVVPYLEQPAVAAAFITQLLNVETDHPGRGWDAQAVVYHLDSIFGDDSRLGDILLSAHTHWVTVDGSEGQTQVERWVGVMNGALVGENTSFASQLLAHLYGYEIQFDPGFQWGDLLGIGRFLLDFFVIGDAISLVDELIIKPLRGQDSSEFTVFLSGVGLWAELGHLAPTPGPEDALNGLAAAAKAAVRKLEDVFPKSAMDEMYAMVYAAKDNFGLLASRLRALIAMSKFTEGAASFLGGFVRAVQRILDFPTRVIENMVTTATTNQRGFEGLVRLLDEPGDAGDLAAGILRRHDIPATQTAMAARMARHADVTSRLVRTSPDIAETLLTHRKWDNFLDYLNANPNQYDDLVGALRKGWDADAMSGDELFALYASTKQNGLTDRPYGLDFDQLAEQGYRWNPEVNTWRTPGAGVVDDVITSTRTLVGTYSRGQLRMTAEMSQQIDDLVAARQAIRAGGPGNLAQASEAVGEAFSRPALLTRYPEGTTVDHIPYRLGGPANGNDQFDQIFQVVHPGGATEIVVIEAKGRATTSLGDLGTRKLPDGRVVEQGTTEYFLDIMRLMKDRGELDALDVLIDAAEDGVLSYTLSAARNLNTPGDISVQVSDFALDLDRIAQFT